MNARERFYNTMHYRPVDRCPIRDFSFWDETLLIWKRYGLPEHVQPGDSANEFFGMDPERHFGALTDLCPHFRDKASEDKGRTEIVRDKDGVILERGKMTSWNRRPSTPS